MNRLGENRIARAFRIQAGSTRVRPQPLLIPYVTAGDPTPEVTVELIETFARAGADIIELGVPYSDPLADGPVIQAASARALAAGTTLSRVLDIGAEVRSRGGRAEQIPLILFTYVNPVLAMGIGQLCERAAEAGFDGLIVPDLPLEEDDELRQAAVASHLSLIPLVAPTSRQRVEQIVARAEGFVYCVSSLGTTGARESFAPEVSRFLQDVRRLSAVPTAVGFGISKPAHVRAFAPHADAVIVGSAIVREIERHGDALRDPAHKKQAHEQLAAFVRSLKSEVN